MKLKFYVLKLILKDALQKSFQRMRNAKIAMFGERSGR